MRRGLAVLGHKANRFSELRPQDNPLAASCSFVVAFCSLFFGMFASSMSMSFWTNVGYETQFFCNLLRLLSAGIRS